MVLSRNYLLVYLLAEGNIKSRPFCFRLAQVSILWLEVYHKFETLLAFRGQVFNFTHMSIAMMSPACLLERMLRHHLSTETIPCIG